MKEYSADDGLRILTYLGILNLTEKEGEVFRSKWNKVYRQENGDLIATTWTLYAEALPFTCREDKDERAMFAIAQFRDSDFGRRLEEIKLDERLKQGEGLDSIIAKSPERYAKIN